MTMLTQTPRPAPAPAGSPSAAGSAVEVIGGVDTHRDTHTAAVIDTTGRLLGGGTFPATGGGYRQLLTWLRSFGLIRMVGVEGTGSYGAGLTAHLGRAGLAVLEVDRPDRKTRRFAGKSDPIDAEAAALAALSGRAAGTPKDRTGAVEALRVLKLTRNSAVRQRADCQRQIRSLIITTPERLRSTLRTLNTTELIRTCAALRPDPTTIGAPEHGAKTALRALARRHQHLTTEIDELAALIEALVADINPTLLALPCVGEDSAAQLLITAGQNTTRLHSEAAFAMLCGVAPIPASSGKTHRHRLNRGGDRQANAALHRIIIVRLRWHQPTRTYAQRRTTEGLTKKEIIRCLKRALAREVYQALTNH